VTDENESKSLMSSFFWILTVILIVGIVTIKVVMKYTEPPIQCPHCGGISVTEVRKERVATRATHRYTGLQGRTDIQMEYRVEYRCNECSHGWKREITETN
jgi:DNA-directed RNA polymerase subunit RPC12/RpoP